MGIQDVVSLVGPASAGDGRRGGAGERDVRGEDPAPGGYHVSVSDLAMARYEADQSRKFEAIRERMRLGYYANKDVVAQVVAALARDISAESTG
jgi:hypothetical protein